MKITVAGPITIGQNPYSTLDMVRYVVATDRRYNGSAEAARAGVRTEKAFEAGPVVELLDEDLRLLAAVVERPMRGWGSFQGTQDVPQRDEHGAVKIKQTTVRVNVPAREFLPLIDPISEAAAKLPPAPSPTLPA